MPQALIAKLLIVDDDDAQLEARCNTLETEGYGTTASPPPRRRAIERASLIQRLRNAEQCYRRLMENARMLSTVTNCIRPVFTYVNPVVRAITGYSPDEFYMDPDLAVRMAHPDDRPLVETLLRGVRLVQGLTSNRGENCTSAAGPNSGPHSPIGATAPRKSRIPVTPRPLTVLATAIRSAPAGTPPRSRAPHAPSPYCAHTLRNADLPTGLGRRNAKPGRA
jgi:PAS fold